jgi:hypothetical protein
VATSATARRAAAPRACRALETVRLSGGSLGAFEIGQELVRHRGARHRPPVRIVVDGVDVVEFGQMGLVERDVDTLALRGRQRSGRNAVLDRGDVLGQVALRRRRVVPEVPEDATATLVLQDPEGDVELGSVVVLGRAGVGLPGARLPGVVSGHLTHPPVSPRRFRASR